MAQANIKEIRLIEKTSTSAQSSCYVDLFNSINSINSISLFLLLFSQEANSALTVYFVITYIVAQTAPSQQIK